MVGNKQNLKLNKNYGKIIYGRGTFNPGRRGRKSRRDTARGRAKRIEGILSHKMSGLLNFVWNRNKSSDKTAK